MPFRNGKRSCHLCGSDGGSGAPILFDPKNSCRLKTVGDYSSWIGAGAGTGKTFTSPNNLVANNVFDAEVAVVGDRILVTSAGGLDTIPNLNNCIYEVTQLANGSVPTILTRTTDADNTPAGEVSAGLYVFVTEGFDAHDSGWLLITNDPITIDVTPLVFIPFFIPSPPFGEQHRPLDQLVHLIAEDSYEEILYTGSRVDSITVWETSAKIKKIREELFTYTGNKVTQVVTKQYDGAGAVAVGETMTEIFTYTGNKVTNTARTVV